MQLSNITNKISLIYKRINKKHKYLFVAGINRIK